MTRVDFYVLAGTDATGAEMLACRLAEKIYKLGHKIYVHTESAQQAQRVDSLMWTFRAGSFVPHARHGEAAPETVPVLIGNDLEPESHTEVLVNLAPQVPGFFSHFERVAEVVTSDPAHRAQAREKFRFYRDRGYELQTHNL